MSCIAGVLSAAGAHPGRKEPCCCRLQTHASPREGEEALAALYSDQCAYWFSRGKHTSAGLTRRLVISHCTVLQARLVQDMQKLSPDHFDWATSIVLGRYPGAVQVWLPAVSALNALCTGAVLRLCCALLVTLP